MFWLCAVLGIFILLILLIRSHLYHKDISYNQQQIINLLEKISTNTGGSVTSNNIDLSRMDLIDLLEKISTNTEYYAKSDNINLLRRDLEEKNNDIISIVKDILVELQDINRRTR